MRIKRKKLDGKNKINLKLKKISNIIRCHRLPVSLRRNLLLIQNAISQLLLGPKNTDFIVLRVHLPLPEKLSANSAGKKRVSVLNFVLEKLLRGPRKRPMDPI
jgi:hypothetical protein